MADDPALSTTEGQEAAGSPPGYVQLTQVRVALADAGEAFSVPDATGRLPIVVLPKQPFRIRNELVIAGIIAIVAGIVLDIGMDLVTRSAILVVGVALIFLGVFRSFIVPVPEASQALLLRRGRYLRTIGPGNHVIPPWIAVSHLVSAREIPFDCPAVEAPTRDDVRVDMDILLTFRISQPERFVYTISAPDFDQVCQAACLDAVRQLIRRKDSDAILDLSADDEVALAADISEAIARYGTEVQRVVVTHVRPPTEFMASREARRLAAVRRHEQDERHALEQRLQADREALARERATAQSELIELEAKNEDLRLARLEARLAAYPNAVRWDIGAQRLEIAKALAANTRAMLQVGGGVDVANALLQNALGAEDDAD